MVELEPIRSSNSRSPRTSRPNSTRSRSQSNRTREPNLTRIYSAQHLDDQSFYHHDWNHEEAPEVKGDDKSDETLNDGEKSPEDLEEKEEPEDRTALANNSDLEAQGSAPLERKKTSKSIKDPNLVRQIVRYCDNYGISAKLLPGNMGRT
jgi:hypothetical protein